MDISFLHLNITRQTDKWQWFLIYVYLALFRKEKLRTLFQNKYKTIITTRLTARFMATGGLGVANLCDNADLFCLF